MAGRSIDIKKTKTFLEMGELPHSTYYGTFDVPEDIKYDRSLEYFKGEKIDKCSDEPYLFSPGPNRAYCLGSDGFGNDFMVFSGYKPLMDNNWRYKIFEKPLDITIILIADLGFVGAVLEEGKVVVLKEMASVKSYNTSKSEKEIFRDRIQNVLNNWERLMENSKFVFIRITKEYKDHFFEGKGDTEDSKYRHIPFETGKPTTREFERVYDRLLRCELHGHPEKARSDFQNESKQLRTASVPDVPTSSSEGSRRLEKKTWPWLDSTLAKRLLVFVESDNGDSFYDAVEAHSKKSQLLEYLNSSHEKFNGGTFLHFAVQKEAPSIVEVLLELGCDATAVDSNSKVPFEYAKLSEVQEVFIDFRQEYPNNCNWNKSKVPERKNSPLHNQRKKAAEIEKKKDVYRQKRSDKLKGRRVENND